MVSSFAKLGLTNGLPFVVGLKCCITARQPITFRPWVMLISTCGVSIIGRLVIVPDRDEWIGGMCCLKVHILAILSVSVPVIIKSQNLMVGIEELVAIFVDIVAQMNHRVIRAISINLSCLAIGEQFSRAGLA